jgi:uncharacterized protein (TIGR00251 family)
LNDAVTLTVHVQPRARRAELAGWHGDAIKIRLRSPPVDGAANAELAAFLAKHLGVPRSAIDLIGGASARRKRLRVRGLTRRRALDLLGLDDP